MSPKRATAPRFRLRPVHIALIYITVSVTWILVSDKVVRLVEGGTVWGVPAQTVKGIGFVVASGVLIYLLTRSATAQAERHARRADEAETRYRSLVETSPDGIAVQVEGKIRFANDALARIFGAESPEQLLGVRVVDVAVSDDREAIGERVRRLNMDRHPAPAAVERFHRCDGGVAVVEVVATPIEFEGENGALVLIRDIGERLAAEEALRESEHRFRRMAANIPGAIFRYILAPDGSDRVEYMSPGCEDIWEIDAAPILRSVRVLWEMIDPEFLDSMTESVAASARTGAPWSQEWRITTPSGKKKWLQGFGQPISASSGEVIWDSVIFDITQKKAAEEEALRAGRRLEHILQNISDGFFLADHEWRYTTINHAGAASVGLAPEQMLGRTMLEVFPDIQGTVWEETYSRVMRTGEPESLEAYYEGLGRWYDARIDATDDGVAVFFRDITDRKQAEQRQQLMMRELDHRVKNNLAAVLAISESSLREANSLAEFAEAFVGRIRAMASMHSLLAAQRWEGVGFVNLIHAVVGPYTDRDGNRLNLHGPDLRVPSNAAPAICMTLHELATNAVKHGALANDHGRLGLEWSFDPATHDLRIRWTERDGPPVSATIEPGFGMDLLKGVIPYELNGAIDLEFTPDGLEVIIFIPGDSLREASLSPITRAEAAK